MCTSVSDTHFLCLQVHIFLCAKCIIASISSTALSGVCVCVVISAERRLQAMQAAVILLPDENREVLQTLLYFLSDIASAQENQMTAENLAVCLAPSILHLNASKKDGASPRCVWVSFCHLLGDKPRSLTRKVTLHNKKSKEI